MSDISVLTECPVCSKSFATAVIARHVDLCLDADADGVGYQSDPKRMRIDSDDTSSSLSTGHSQRSQNTRPVAKATTSRTLVDMFSPKAVKPTSNRTLIDILSPKSTKRPVSPSSVTSPTVPLIAQSTASGSTDTASSLSNKPLAERLRPSELAQFVGQSHVLGAKSMLRAVIEADLVPSMVLWGPPGCGKTSLAHIIAVHCRKMHNSKFILLSATNSGVNDVKEVVRNAKNDFSLLKRKTILFIDEIHRFNKLQQDTFLPHVENGTITLIGATTENPSFSLNSALLSRCRVFVLEKLSSDDIMLILKRAADQLNVVIIVDDGQEPKQPSDAAIKGEKDGLSTGVEEKALEALANLCDGDARTAINCFQLAVQSLQAGAAALGHGRSLVTVDCIKESLQRTHLLYDKKGDEHFNCISALHKSMRGSDGDASLYWLGRMLQGGEDPLYVARRLIRFASEDIGLADPLALNQAVAAYQASHAIGMPECEVILAQCVVYLAEAPKSIRVYQAYSRVKESITNHEGPLPGVPLHLRNAPTKLMKNLGYGRDYLYNPAYKDPVEQSYLPESLRGTKFLQDDD